MFFLNQSFSSYLNPNWVFLDSESTDHILCNKKLLKDVNQTTDGEYLRLHTAGGLIDSYYKGKFGDLTVWYNPKCLANILSLSLVTDRYRVTMDSSKENAFNLHISQKHIIQFVSVDQGLYIFDTSKIDIHKLRQDFSFLTTVDQNKKYFCRR